MKKEVLIVGIILTIIIFTNALCQNYLSHAVDRIDVQLEEMVNLSKKCLKEKNGQEENKAKKYIDDISKEWEKYEKNLSLYVEHEELEKIDTSIVIIKSYINANNYEDTLAKAEECIFVLNHIRKKQQMSIANLF